MQFSHAYDTQEGNLVDKEILCFLDEGKFPVALVTRETGLIGVKYPSENKRFRGDHGIISICMRWPHIFALLNIILILWCAFPFFVLYLFWSRSSYWFIFSRDDFVASLWKRFYVSLFYSTNLLKKSLSWKRRKVL